MSSNILAKFIIFYLLKQFPLFQLYQSDFTLKSFVFLACFASGLQTRADFISRDKKTPCTLSHRVWGMSAPASRSGWSTGMLLLMAGSGRQHKSGGTRHPQPEHRLESRGFSSGHLAVFSSYQPIQKWVLICFLDWVTQRTKLKSEWQLLLCNFCSFCFAWRNLISSSAVDESKCCFISMYNRAVN